MTAHTTALFPIFIIIAAKLITPYGTGPSPIWYGAGYISQGRWWALGAIFAAIFMAVLLVGVLIFL